MRKLMMKSLLFIAVGALPMSMLACSSGSNSTGTGGTGGQHLTGTRAASPARRAERRERAGQRAAAGAAVGGAGGGAAGAAGGAAGDGWRGWRRWRRDGWRGRAWQHGRGDGGQRGDHQRCHQRRHHPDQDGPGFRAVPTARSGGNASLARPMAGGRGTEVMLVDVVTDSWKTFDRSGSLRGTRGGWCWCSSGAARAPRVTPRPASGPGATGRAARSGRRSGGACGGGRRGARAPDPRDGGASRPAGRADRQMQAERQQDAAAQASLTAQVDVLAAQARETPPVPLTPRLGLSFTGFLQADWVVSNQLSVDQLNPSGAPLNQSEVFIRRARLRAAIDRWWVAGLIEFDGNTVNGPAARIIGAEASLKWPPRARRRPPGGDGDRRAVQDPVRVRDRPERSRTAVPRAVHRRTRDVPRRVRRGRAADGGMAVRALLVRRHERRADRREDVSAARPQQRQGLRRPGGHRNAGHVGRAGWPAGSPACRARAFTRERRPRRRPSSGTT